MVVEIAGASIALIIVVLLVIPLIRYRLTSRRLLITVLGIPIRWVSLKNIRYLSDHARDAAEPWANTFTRKNRSLYVRKRRGLFRYLHLTPEKRFVFKAEIEKAIRLQNPDASFDETSFYDRPESGTPLTHRTAR